MRDDGVRAALAATTGGTGPRAVEPVREGPGVQGDSPGDSREGHSTHGPPEREKKDPRKQLSLIRENNFQNLDSNITFLLQISQHSLL